MPNLDDTRLTFQKTEVVVGLKMMKMKFAQEVPSQLQKEEDCFLLQWRIVCTVNIDYDDDVRCSTNLKHISSPFRHHQDDYCYYYYCKRELALVVRTTEVDNQIVAKWRRRQYFSLGSCTSILQRRTK